MHAFGSRSIYVIRMNVCHCLNVFTLNYTQSVTIERLFSRVQIYLLAATTGQMKMTRCGNIMYFTSSAERLKPISCACNFYPVTSCSNMKWLSEVTGVIWVIIFIPLQTDHHFLMRGKQSAASAFSSQCQSEEITGGESLQEWKLNRSLFWFNMPIPIMLYLSDSSLLIISPSHQSVFLHQGK